jgi:hypothetical protein
MWRVFGMAGLTPREKLRDSRAKCVQCFLAFLTTASTGNTRDTLLRDAYAVKKHRDIIAKTVNLFRATARAQSNPNCFAILA